MDLIKFYVNGTIASLEIGILLKKRGGTKLYPQLRKYFYNHLFSTDQRVLD